MTQTNNERRKRIVIIGGGITGLTAAFYTKRLFAERQQDVDLTIVEQHEAMGGKIRTLRRDGFVIERGPDSFLSRKLPIIELTRDLGLQDELAGLNPAANKTYMLNNGVLHRMPPGLVLGIPTQLRPFLRSGLVSRRGKARALMDLATPCEGEPTDESLGEFLERRLGREMLENVAEPLLAGIYAGNTYKLSLQATFPQFQSSEQKFGSLIRGMMEGRRNPPPPSPLTQEIPEHIRQSVFLTYRNGLSTVIEALEAVLADATHHRDAVTAVERQTDGTYAIRCKQGSILHADAVIMALPGYTTAALLDNVPEAKWLGDMDYVSVANVVLAFDRSTLEHGLDGSGFLVPRKENRLITACTWTSSKWLHTAPEGKALIRCYVGRAGDERWMEMSDETLLAGVRHDLKELMGIEAEPLFVELTRLHRSMPQYPVGHLDRIRTLRAALAAQMPGVQVTGAAFEGVGLPDCIRQGKTAAEAVAAYLDANGSQ